jgi:hypothetical protein
MAIDRGDWHYEEAGDWQRACWHIGLYLWWAAERGLASEEISAKAAAQDPTNYFIRHCDAKLWDEDMNDEGVAFADACYRDYLKAVSAYAKQREVGDYEIPDDEQSRAWLFEWLDRRLEAWRQEARSGA